MNEMLTLITGMTPYLLLGFFLAGLMHAFVPNTLYRRYMGGHTFRSVVRAALLGIPLPLCSCGVIPTAMSLRREGASKGATVSFLIATPQTGVDSIVATYSLMGLPFALLRPFIALVTSLLGGCLVNRFDSTLDESKVPSAAASSVEEGSSLGFIGKLQLAFRYAFVEMMQDIGRWLVVGLLVAGLITVFVPASFFARFADQSLLSMLLVLACAIPMYLCATGSIPIAVALMLKGLSPGSALVLLMAGPAVNVASMMVIGKVMGRRTLLLYLLSIVSGAMGFGLAIDHLLPRAWFTDPLVQMQGCHEHELSLFSIGCSVLFFLLLLNAFVQRYRRPHACGCGCSEARSASSGSSISDGHPVSEACCCSSSCEAATPSTGSCCVAGDAVHTSGCSGQDLSLDSASHVWHTQVKGMSCNHCKNNVEKAIRSIAGVEDVEVDLVSGAVAIYGVFDAAEVVEAVTSLGFEMDDDRR
ncbi:permease [gut metagenome]|uniref:Permease n=1 Tax=gut metagenome TaxID=749906 RepID=J9GBJ5_9ZZZZ